MKVVVQHHPARAALLPRLVERLPGAVVVVDPEPDGPPAPWRTYQRCLCYAEDEPLLVVQDDALVCRNVVPACMEIARVFPDVIVALYVGRVPQHLARPLTIAYDRGERWVGPLRLSTWLPCVALLWPAGLARLARDAPAVAAADDAVLGRWAHQHVIRPYAVVPSLVGHDDAHPSLVGQRSGTTWRQAACFAGEDADALTWWDGRPLPHG